MLQISRADGAGGATTHEEFSPGGRLVFLPGLLMCCLALSTLMFGTGTTGLTVVGTTSVIWVSSLVIRRGGSYLTPSAVFFLASGVFVGIASLYLAALGSIVVTQEALRNAAVMAFVSTVAVDMVVLAFSIRWRTSWPTRSALWGRRDFGHFVVPQHFMLKAILLVALSKMPQLTALSDAVGNSLGLFGVLMLALSASSVRQHIKWVGDAAFALIAFIVPLAWMASVFQGGGRLAVAGLGIALLMAWNLTRPLQLHKVAIIAMVPLFLLAAGENRRQMDNADPRRVKEAPALGAGLQSVYNPLETLAEETRGGDTASGKSIGPRWGATFANSFMLPVPRSWWKNKPTGFGAELTAVLRPNLVSSGHSMAALSQGEWYANFGFAGLFAMPLVIGWILAKLDYWHSNLVKSRLSQPSDWWAATILLCLVAGLGDLFWVGTFTFFERGGLAALVGLVAMGMSVRSASTPAADASFDSSPNWPPELRRDMQSPVSVDEVP